MRAVPQFAIDLAKSKETLVLFVYDDAHYPPREAKPGDHIDGTLTAGYGHTGALVIGQIVTKQDADRWIADDFDLAAYKLLRVVSFAIINDLTVYQYAAVVDFVYNLGTGDPKKPEWNIWKVLRAKQYDQVPLEFAKFVNARIDGKVVKEKGLVARRNAEIALWSTCEPGSVDAPMPSSMTRKIATPPTVSDPVPAIKSKTIISGAVAAVAAMPVAYTQAATALGNAHVATAHPSIIASLSGISALCTGLTVLFAYLHKQAAQN